MNLSIVIPIYNVEKYVAKCLHSCLEQDIPHDDYEVIVVNDGSPDRSLEIVEAIAKEHANIRIVSQENQGLSLARNKGLSLARGEYVWFVDSDDWIAKDCLKKLVELCFEHQLDILHFCAANALPEKNERRFSYPEEESRVMSGKEALLKGIRSPCAPFSIYKRNFLLNNNLSFYPKIFHEDSEFAPRAWYAAEKVILINDICYHVFENNSSITRAPNPKKAFDLIKVCESIDKFSKLVEKEFDSYFNGYISMNINSSLANSYFMTSSEIDALNKSWKKFRYLFIHLKKAKKTKYRLEYYLFMIFPYYCQVYKVIQLLNSRRYKSKNGLIP